VRRLIGLGVVAAAAVVAASATAALLPVVPRDSQQAIKKRTNLYAFVPARAAFGFRYYAWKFQPGPRPALRIWFRHKTQRNRQITFVASPQTGDCAAGKEKTFQLDGNKVYWSHTATEQ